ncbi:MAG: DUF4832 domain-containing protein [Paludibacteraceae bacterium]|nr:DUF4832 domain-containing protein [Paludibacteraceae bacterium]
MKRLLTLVFTSCFCLLASATSVSYTADNTTIFKNPERGFTEELSNVVSESDPHVIQNEADWFFDYTGINDETGYPVARPNETLVMVLYNFKNYRDKALTSTILNGFDEDMQILRNKGYKCVLRFAYTEEEEDKNDAGRSRVVAHIAQLKPHLKANADVIYALEAGFVGVWGEWYYSDNFGNETQHMNSNRIAVIDALLDAVPEDRFLLVRYPMIKTEYLTNKGISTAALTSSEAYTSAIKARIGCHNDAFLNTYGDNGTYASDALSDDPDVRQYIADETLYVPNGGETNVESTSRASSMYTQTEAQMIAYHWSFCGESYAKQMTQKWHIANSSTQVSGSTIFDELDRKMGYRYQLVSGTYSDAATAGGTMSVNISLKNVGYAPLYNYRRACIVLKNGSTTYSIPLTSDPRRWAPNGATTNITETLTVPAGVPAGTYDLYLHMPDTAYRLKDDPRYAIRFANKISGTDVWNSTLGMNNLGASITISAGGAPTPTLTLNTSSRDFGSITVGDSDTRTFTVTGSNLTNSVSISSNNAALTVSPGSIPKDDATSGETVTLTLTPTAAGSGSAIVTVSSSGATSKTVSVTWTATSGGGGGGSGAVELPGTVDKSNHSAVSDNTWWTTNTNYYEFKGGSGNYTSRYIEWEVNVAITGDYFISEDYYCGTVGQGWEFKLFDTGHNLLDTYNTGSLELLQNTYATASIGKWHLPAGNYIIRVRNVREWAEPKVKSFTFTYDGEILPVIPVVPADPSGTSRTYTADNTTVFPNPERGFLDQLEMKTSEKTYCVKGREWWFADSEQDGQRANERLVLLLYYLDSYKTTATLPSSVLTAFDEDMQVLRNLGYKCILRYAYTQDDKYDAAKSIVLSHINQLKSHWAANKDVIYAFQAGFIGRWGEWYYTNNFDNQNSHMTADRAEVVSALVDALPSDVYILLRTPLFKTEYLNDATPLTYSEAYTGTPKARFGHHNDAYLNGAQNQGTYSDTATQKPYLARETFYVPIGGETNIETSQGISDYATAEKAQGETSRLHWTFCKGGWPVITMAAWQADGTYAEFNKKLGYRYQLVNGTYTNSSTVGGTMKVYMNIRNVGYAPLYNERHAYIILTNASNTYSIQMETDPRRWRPNNVVTEIGEELDLPADIVPGTYNLYLSLPDNHPSLASDVRYAVRFANTGIWDATHGWNNLNATITITSGGPTPTMTVSPASIDFGTIGVGSTDTRTFTLTSSNLTNNVNISSDNAALTVSPTSIAKATANAAAQTITLTLTPTVAGSGSATVTVSSSGATNKTVTVNWTATSGGGDPTIVDLPGTVNKSNVNDVSGDMTYYNTDYFDYGPSDGENLGRWAEWNVRINTPAQFTISVVVDYPTVNPTDPDGYQWKLQLLNGGGSDVVTPYESVQNWGDKTYTYDAKWDLSGVTPGTYTLRVKNLFDWAQPKLRSVTFAAAAVPSTYTVTWDANGGTCGTATSNVTAGSAVGTLPIATKTGYTFIGWFTETSGGTQITTSTVPTGNVTYHAQYSINSYALTVNTNNATYGSVSGGGTYTYNTVHAITATPNTGYAFDHWELNSTNVSTSATYNVTIPANAVTYTAIFVPGTVNYTVKHMQQNTERNGYYVHQTETLSGTTGTTTAAVAKVYEGFTAQQPISQKTIAANGSTEVTIYYNRNSYTITYNKGTYGTGSQVTDTKYYGVNLTLRGATFTRGGYTQTGWASNAAGTDYAYDLSGTYSGNSAITLYPYWTAPEYVIFDNNNGAGDGNWSTPSNWQGGYLPSADQTARIIKPCTVDITDAVAKSVLIATGSTYTGHLTIAPTAGLNVTQKIQKAVDGNYASPTAISASDLTIQASSVGQGALVLGTEDGTAGATVQLYSKAYIDAHKHWQYMGIPFSNTPLAQSLFSGGYMYRWDETTAAGWNSVTNSTTLNPFAGYCLSQSAAKTYEMTGTLCASSNRNLTVSHTSAGQSGANLFSNSWTAPIEIASFEDGDFSTAAIDKTIYLFNTGSLAEYTAIGGEANTGSSPGQFFAIPIHAAPYAVGLPTVIPPMQGFQVMTTATGGLTLNYARLTAPYDGSHLATEPLKAPKSEETPDVLRLTVYGQSGQSSSDRFYLLKHSACTEGFDNGWDGKKILGSDVVSLYSLSPDGNMAVDSRGEMLGTDIVFCAGTDTHYTIEMYYTGSQTLYLFDRVEGVCVPIISGTNYSFEAASNAAPSIRFRIIANDATGIDQVQNNEVPSTKLLRDGHLYIRHAGKLYDARGRKVSE